MTDEQLPSADFEPRDVPLLPILLFGVGIAGLVLFAGVAMYWLLGYLTDQLPAPQRERPAGLPTVESPAAIQDSLEPAVELADVRQRDEAILHGYGWIDREQGIAHVPIERAMQLVLDEGLPVRKTKPPGNNREGPAP